MEQGTASQSATARGAHTRPMFRRVAQAVGVLLVLLASLIVAALAFSQTPTFRSWLREQVVTQANAALNGRVAIGSLEGNLLGSLMLTDLQLTMEGAELMTVKRMTATYNPLELIRNRLVLHKVSFDGIRLRLIQNDQGWNAA